MVSKAQILDRVSGLLDDLVAAYKLNEKADAAKADAEAQTLRTFLRTRTESLRSDKAITGAAEEPQAAP
ncbi:hypothetical protein [Nonomuraea longicatena]|uniref:Uncharacterized protein n=1 Tax=Nonomuraea longicatena TaxID=83682 RepID=A0ABP3ZCE3_9ACTN